MKLHKFTDVIVNHMKRIVLRESELVNLIHRVINEVETADCKCCKAGPQPTIDDHLEGTGLEISLINESSYNVAGGWVPTPGWEEFWSDWNGDDVWVEMPDSKKELYRVEDKAYRKKVEDGKSVAFSSHNPDIKMPLSDEEFLVKYKKSREDFKVIFRAAIVKAKRAAVAYFKEYYSDKNPDVYQKLIPKFMKKDYTAEVKDKVRVSNVEYIHEKLDMIAEYKDYTYVHYSSDSVNDVRLIRAWAWVKDSESLYRYNINLYNFTEPTTSGWEFNIISSTIHELAHIIDNILSKDLGIDPIPFDIRTDAYEIPTNKDDDREAYVIRKSESYARMHTIRWLFGVHSNITAEEWVKLWMDKVNNGEIAFDESYVWEEDRGGKTIPKPKFKSFGDKVYLELSRRLMDRIWGGGSPWVKHWAKLKWDRGRPSTLNSDRAGKPQNYDNVWTILSKIKYEIGKDPDDPTAGYDASGIGALLAEVTIDPEQVYTVGYDNEDLFWIIFDFSELAKANELYVKVDPTDVQQGDKENLGDFENYFKTLETA